VKPRTGSKRGPNAKMIKYLAVPLPNPSTVLGALGVRQLRVKACFKQITKNQFMFFHELPWTNIADRARLSRLFVVWKRFRIPLSPPSSSEIRQIRAKSQIAIRLCYSASLRTQDVPDGERGKISGTSCGSSRTLVGASDAMRPQSSHDEMS
jgi:hypothetical protein